jgi:hypothetical protein
MHANNISTYLCTPDFMEVFKADTISDPPYSQMYQSSKKYNQLIDTIKEGAIDGGEGF